MIECSVRFEENKIIALGAYFPLHIDASGGKYDALERKVKEAIDVFIASGNYYVADARLITVYPDIDATTFKKPFILKEFDYISFSANILIVIPACKLEMESTWKPFAGDELTRAR